MRGVAPIIAVILLVMLGALLAARVFAPQAVITGDDQVNLAVLVGWLAMLSISIFWFGRMPIGNAVKSLLIWAGIGLFLVAVYALRDDFSALVAEVRGAIVPSAALEVGAPLAAGESAVDEAAAPAGAVQLRRASDGHFWADADINGTRLRMMVDTGASTVALTEADARRAGLNPNTLRYTTQVSTAGGMTRGAPVRLRRVSIGSVRLENVDAIVIEGDSLPMSLLGMSFLGRLSRYEATQQTLTLRR